MPRKRREGRRLEQASNGIWYVTWYDPELRRTRRLTTHAREIGEAELCLARMIVADDPLFKGRVGKQLTVNMMLDDYWNEHGNTDAVASPENVKHSIKHLRAHFGLMPVAEIEIADCRAFLDARVKGTLPTTYRSRGVKPGTVRTDLAILNAAINHAIRWKRLERAKAPTIELPPASPPRLIWLYKDEIQRLFDAAEGRALRFAQIAYYTAGRRRSIETLTCFQVSLERNRINLDKIGARRTNKRRPVVPIVPALRPIIETALAETDNEYVLGSPGKIERAWEAAIAAAGLERLPEREFRPAGKPTPHCLRHSRATHLLQDNVDPYAVAQLLGDKLDTVLNTYGHWCGEYLEQALSKAQEIR